MAASDVTMEWPDIVIIVLYFVIVLGVGLLVSVGLFAFICV